MTERDQDFRPPRGLVGLVRVREHCTFNWRSLVESGVRVVEVIPTHCADCIAEVRRRGYRLEGTACEDRDDSRT